MRAIARWACAAWGWFERLRLPGWLGALIGGAAGLATGWLIAASMRAHAIFTERYQDLTASAVLLALWLAIGIVAGLAVLAPLDEASLDEG